MTTIKHSTVTFVGPVIYAMSFTSDSQLVYDYQVHYMCRWPQEGVKIYTWEQLASVDIEGKIGMICLIITDPERTISTGPEVKDWWEIPNSDFQLALSRTKSDRDDFVHLWVQREYRDDEFIGKEWEASVAFSFNDDVFPVNFQKYPCTTRDYPNEEKGEVGGWLRRVTVHMSDLLDNRRSDGHANIKVAVSKGTFKSTELTAHKYFEPLRTQALDLLTETETTDLVLEFKGEMETKRIFLEKAILQKRSPVLLSALSEALNDDIDKNAVSKGSDTKHPTRIPLDRNFDLWHVILYYVYARDIALATNDPASGGEPQKGRAFEYRDSDTGENVVEIDEAKKPKLCLAERLYDLAASLDFQELQPVILEFLRETCTKRNIRCRLSPSERGLQTSLHPDIQDIYVEEFIKLI